MALISCPECGNQVSDKARSCPHCGFPLNGVVDSDIHEETKTPMNKKRVKKRSIICLITIILVLSIGVVVLIAVRSMNNKQQESEKSQVLENAEKSVVKVVCSDSSGNVISTGSGFFYQSSGSVVTNFHVVAGAWSIEIVSYDDKTSEASDILRAYEKYDLAILKVDAKDIYPVLMKASDGSKSTKKGDAVYAIGSPLGLKNTVSEGIISGEVKDGAMTVLQFTAPISPGSSGGALLNETGELIGITYASFEDGQNLNLAIPVERLSELIGMNINADGVYSGGIKKFSVLTRSHRDN